MVDTYFNSRIAWVAVEPQPPHTDHCRPRFSSVGATGCQPVNGLTRLQRNVRDSKNNRSTARH
jgi:hypothetical protein